MSEPTSTHHDDIDETGRVFRAALPGWQSVLSRRTDAGAPTPALFAPGRAHLEWSILLSAFSMLAPACAPGALAFALLARRASHPRWLAAFVVAIWSGLLGVIIRAAVGGALIP
jgi:hypothetical protein